MALAISAMKRAGAGAVSIVKGTITASGSYSTGGDTLDLSTAPVEGIARVPWSVRIYGQSGYLYEWIPGTTLANGKVKVRVNTGAGANLGLPEHTAATYNAGVSGDTITFEAIFTNR